MEILVQLGDFFLKAAVAYVQTPDGQRELDDIELAVGDAIGDMLPFDAPASDLDVESSAPDQPRRPRNPDRFKKRNVRS